MHDAIAWYEAHADEVVPRYEGYDPTTLNAWFRPFLPAAPALVIDVGAGSGRDAAWLAGLGLAVIAVEPTRALREGAQAHHQDPRIRWVDDRLPDLDRLHAEGVRADAVLLSAVWMHLPPAVRGRALTRLIGLLVSGGLLALTIRQGPADPERAMHPADAEEIGALSANLPLEVLHLARAEDVHRRPGVTWLNLAFRRST